MAVAHRLHIYKYDPKKDEAAVKYIEANLRDMDRIEIAEMGKFDGSVGVEIREDYENYILYNDANKPMGIFGISRERFSLGHAVWCLLTNEMDTTIGYQRSFVQLSRSVIAAWTEEGKTLFNMIHKENRKSKRWLRSLGAIIQEDVSLGDMQLFIIRGKE